MARAAIQYADDTQDNDPFFQHEDDLLDILKSHGPFASLLNTRQSFCGAREACIALMGVQAYGAWLAAREAIAISASALPQARAQRV